MQSRVGYVRLEGEPKGLEGDSKQVAIEISQVPSSTDPKNDTVISIPGESKLEKKEDELELDQDAKKKLMDPTGFNGLNDRTRLSIMGAISIEMSTLKDFPVDKLKDALRQLILKNPELRKELKPGEGNGLFVIPKREWDRMMGDGVQGLGSAACAVMDPCSNPFACTEGGGEIAAGCALVACFCAAVIGCIWATLRPGIATLGSGESSTTKALKLLMPVAASITVLTLLYRESESLGDWSASKNMSRGFGEHGIPWISGWITYLLLACCASQFECKEDKHDEEQLALERYFSKHPVDPAVAGAVASSNIEKLLLNYQSEGDSRAVVNAFSRAVLISLI